MQPTGSRDKRDMSRRGETAVGTRGFWRRHWAAVGVVVANIALLVSIVVPAYRLMYGLRLRPRIMDSRLLIQPYKFVKQATLTLETQGKALYACRATELEAYHPAFVDLGLFRAVGGGAPFNPPEDQASYLRFEAQLANGRHVRGRERIETVAD